MLNDQLVEALQKGVNIIRYPNGAAKKVFYLDSFVHSGVSTC